MKYHISNDAFLVYLLIEGPMIYQLDELQCIGQGCSKMVFKHPEDEIQIEWMKMVAGKDMANLNVECRKAFIANSAVNYCNIYSYVKIIIKIISLAFLSKCLMVL